MDHAVETMNEHPKLGEVCAEDDHEYVEFLLEIKDGQISCEYFGEGSQPVRSLQCDFRVWENRRHYRGLGSTPRVSARQFRYVRPCFTGFVTPVSARHFPISVSACWRPVRYGRETGSQGRTLGVERDCGAKVRDLGRLSMLLTLIKRTRCSAPPRATNTACLWRGR
jgi:hypothetical protein